MTEEQQQRQHDSAEGEEEGDGLVFGVSEDLVQSRERSAAHTGSFDFDGLLQPPLRVHIDLTKGNGGTTWPAGVTLATYLLRRKREALKELSIVELGAGGGLVGLAVAMGCRPKHTLHITDQDSMLALMRQNIALNNLEGQVSTSVYNWGEATPSTIPKHPDIVLAADCVYFEPAFPLLQQTLRDLIGPSTICYFCYKRRRRADQHFMRKVKKEFLVEDVDDDPDREFYARDNISLCTIRRKREG